MSRERPIEPPRVVPDEQRPQRAETPSQRRSREELEQLKKGTGAGVFGSFAAAVHRRALPKPAFIRRGYQADIGTNLKAFFTQRPRPWRYHGNDSCKPTRKERLQAQRRAAAQRSALNMHVDRLFPEREVADAG